MKEQKKTFRDIAEVRRHYMGDSPVLSWAEVLRLARSRSQRELVSPKHDNEKVTGEAGKRTKDR